jgi:serine/threonine protein kinase
MRLEGVYETENSIYVILEYLEGSQLNDLLKVRIDSSRVAVSSIPSSLEQYCRIS